MSDLPSPELTVAVQTLIVGGFILDRVERRPDGAMVFCHRFDEFGVRVSYCFFLTAKRDLSDTSLSAVTIAANRHKAQVVIIGRHGSSIPQLEWERFLGIFGGPVYSSIPLEPEFGKQLEQLGRNELPAGLTGKADDLYEAYVKVALEFILGGRVLRYGQDRRFEARADGLILPHQGFSALYDAKAYSGDGYEVSLDSIRQFGSYVNDFSSRYASYLNRLNTFVVISTNFSQKDGTLEGRSRDLISECGVPLSVLTSNTLVKIIKLVAGYPSARHSINWSRVFTDPVVSVARVEKELEAIKKDGVISRPPKD